MPRLALVQMAMTNQLEANLERAIHWIGQAQAQGGQIVVLPELFESLYFCQHQREEYFSLAHPLQGHPFLPRFQDLARRLQVVLPVSFFERAGQAHFNSLAMIDADGEILGVYRKSHIPDGPGYQEKYYFNPGDTGFRVWETRYGRLGVGICWDQWYPEAARIMSLLGAELLLYPTAIGSEPNEAGHLDTRLMWQRAMIGHAVSNSIYLAAPNRVGCETVGGTQQTFYGHSFIANYAGDLMGQLGESEEGVLLANLDYPAARSFRAGMGFFRDRRPELYGPLLTLDGQNRR